jgi:hypothetical protein
MWPFKSKSKPTQITATEAMRRMNELPVATTPEQYLERARSLAGIAEAQGDREFAGMFQQEADMLAALLRARPGSA